LNGFGAFYAFVVSAFVQDIQPTIICESGVQSGYEEKNDYDIFDFHSVFFGTQIPRIFADLFV